MQTNGINIDISLDDDMAVGVTGAMSHWQNRVIKVGLGDAVVSLYGTEEQVKKIEKIPQESIAESENW
jgi:hypothetical protein